jgi:hypothetical protein
MAKTPPSRSYKVFSVMISTSNVRGSHQRAQ